MGRDVRFNRRRAGMAAIAGLAALVALIATASAPAVALRRRLHPGRPHMPRHDGLGRPRLHQEFQPVHRHGPAQRRVRARRVLRAAHHQQRRRRRPHVSVARAELEVEQRQQDADAEPRARTRSGATASRSPRPTSSTASPPASRTRSWTWSATPSPDTNIASVKASGPYKVVIKLKTIDSQFIAANLNLQFVVPKHIWSKVTDPATFTNPNPVGSGPFNESRPLHGAGLRLQQEPDTTGRRARRRSRASSTRRLRRTTPRSSPIQSGQVDWTHNFVPNVAQAYIGEGSEALPRVLRDDGVSALARVRHHAVPVQHRRVPQGAEPRDQPQRRVEARRVRLRAADRRARPQRHLPGVGHGQPCKAAAQTAATYNPTAAKKTADGRRLHVQGRDADRPEGQPGQPRHPRDLGLVGLGRVEPDHHEEPPGDRHQLERRARARLELVVSERVVDEEPDAALADRVAGVAVRLLQLATCRRSKFTPSGQDATNTGNWAHYSEREGDGAPQPVEGDPRPGEAAAAIARSWRRIFLQDQPIVPLFVGPRWSTYSTKYFHCFTSPKNFYGDPIFTHGPRQHPLVHADLPRRQGRRVTTR